MMTPADRLSQELEKNYRIIEQERMQDVPILNPRIRVEAVQFRLFQGSWFGVMLTPWFMNLMLLPDQNKEDEIWQKQVGDKRTFAFEAGRFEFIFGDDDLIGPHYMCALYSPMFDFADHEAALHTAQAIMEVMMLPSEPDELDEEKNNQDRMEEIWAQEEEPEIEDARPEIVEEVQHAEPVEYSRRSFLRMKRTNTPENEVENV